MFRTVTRRQFISKICREGLGEGSQWAKCLLNKHEKLSLVSGTPCERCASITPVMGRWRQADLGALLASSPANPCAPALVEDHVLLDLLWVSKRNLGCQVCPGNLKDCLWSTVPPSFTPLYADRRGNVESGHQGGSHALSWPTSCFSIVGSLYFL